jgi:hypothetical protein
MCDELESENLEVRARNREDADGRVLKYQEPTNRVRIHENLFRSTRGLPRASNLKVDLSHTGTH